MTKALVEPESSLLRGFRLASGDAMMARVCSALSAGTLGSGRRRVAADAKDVHRRLSRLTPQATDARYEFRTNASPVQQSNTALASSSGRKAPQRAPENSGVLRQADDDRNDTDLAKGRVPAPRQIPRLSILSAGRSFRTRETPASTRISSCGDGPPPLADVVIQAARCGVCGPSSRPSLTISMSAIRDAEPTPTPERPSRPG